MADAKIDDNGYPAIYGISCVDGVTPVRIQFNPSNGGMKVDDTTVISIVPAETSFVDSNDRPVAKGVSSSDSNVTLPWYVNPATGAVLIDT